MKYIRRNNERVESKARRKVHVSKSKIHDKMKKEMINKPFVRSRKFASHVNSLRPKARRKVKQERKYI